MLQPVFKDWNLKMPQLLVCKQDRDLPTLNRKNHPAFKDNSNQVAHFGKLFVRLFYRTTKSISIFMDSVFQGYQHQQRPSATMHVPDNVKKIPLAVYITQDAGLLSL